MAINPTCEDLVEPHKRDSKSATKPENINVYNVVNRNTNSNDALQRM